MSHDSSQDTRLACPWSPGDTRAACPPRVRAPRIAKHVTRMTGHDDPTYPDDAGRLREAQDRPRPHAKLRDERGDQTHRGGPRTRRTARKSRVTRGTVGPGHGTGETPPPKRQVQ